MKPIIMRTEDVRAILDGQKTMARMPVKTKATDLCVTEMFGLCGWHKDRPLGYQFDVIKPPYQPGDVLWVRETWAKFECAMGFARIYRADEGAEKELWYCHPDRWCSPVTMPRPAARLFLRVKDVRAERVQDISVEDVIADGAGGVDNEIRNPDPETHESIRAWNRGWAQHVFSKRWDARNAKRGHGWDRNPWVWVIEFERTTQEEANE